MNLNDNVEKLCDPCIESKHTKIIGYKKKTLTTRKLQEIYADLWELYNLLLLLEKIYIGLLFDKFTCKSWVLLLQSKEKFFDAFKLWLLQAKVYREKLGYLQADGRKKFVNAVLKSFCNKKGIMISYAAPYMHEENEIAEQCWRTFAIIKDSLLINSGLPINFWAKEMDTGNYLRNRLSTRRNSSIFITKEAWTNTK